MERNREAGHLVGAGIVAALVGYTGAFAVVLSGLRAVGASPAQAASGLLAVTATMGLGTLWLTFRHRMPILLAWSTPGAALLASTGSVHGGWAAAIGAFLVCGTLIMLTGLWPRLGAVIASIPTPIAQAMLAGVVLRLCLTPVRGFVAHPWEVAPIILAWLTLLRLAPRWAVPAAFLVALVTISIDAQHGGVHGTLLPQLRWTMPRLTSASVLTVALPLYIVTMAGQNVPGTAVLASFGYEVPWRETMTTTGSGTIAGAFAGGQAINLAAISAALVAGPEVHSDTSRRWPAAASAGVCFLTLALVSGALTTLASAAPADVVGAVAGLALLGTLASSLSHALSAHDSRQAGALTFVVSGSGASFLGVGSAFWALLAGLALLVITSRRQPSAHSERPQGMP